DLQLKLFKDKITLIGIIDPQIASTIETAFDDQLPGVALHAFALDNLSNHRWLKKDLFVPSIIIFILFLIGFVFIQSKLKSKKLFVYLIFFSAFLIIGFILFTFLNYSLAFSFFIMPFLFLVITDLSVYLFEKRNLLHSTLNESEVLKNLLSSKQEQLSKLQNELDLTDESSTGELLEKIKSLKNDIEKLKGNEEDKTAAATDFDSETKDFYGIVYRSKAINDVVEIIKKTAPEDATVLLIGESGTGKEIAAKAIHTLSKRKDNNFVAVNCAALSESLLESELFGHIKGSFTGVTGDTIGKFEVADKGTIFLDEIGETSENFQVKLLRVLQNGEIEKVGSSKQQFVNVRIIAATNKELDSAVKEKKFREDLYYRLNVIKIELPPLRERKKDIEVLTAHFLKKEAPDINISKAVLESLLNAPWKGNVRELEAVIKHAVILAKSENRNMLQLSDLPKELIKISKYEFDDLVLESLRNKMFFHSSITETAKELGNVNRTTVVENFRGITFKTLYENDFEQIKSAGIIAGTDETEIRKKVEEKIQTFLNNIRKDIEKSGSGNFDEIRSKFSSKYKNLPVKFHFYQDEVIKWLLSHKD
ncbi:MAG: sigma 54-interacting transcriptional regulator, partial [Ignavibacteriaceae bacterium]